MFFWGCKGLGFKVQGTWLSRHVAISEPLAANDWLQIPVDRGYLAP